MEKNTGFDPIKEEQDRKPTDYIFAGNGKDIRGIAEDIDNIANYLPTGEVQRGLEDFLDCATRSALNILETKLNYLIKNAILSIRNIKWLSDQGYMDKNGSVCLSDRYTAVRSGTTRSGNSLIAPIEAIRKWGCVPKSVLPASKTMSWDEYHNPAAITPEILAIGVQFAKRFPVNYDRVYYQDHQFEVKDVLDVALYAWEKPVNGVYQRTDKQPNHAVMKYLPAHTVFDNYLDYDGDFIKVLVNNFKFYPYYYRVVLNEIIVEDETEKKKMIQLRRLKGGERVYALVGGKKYWATSWDTLDNFKEVLGYETLEQLKNSVVEVEQGVLDGYKNGGVLGNLSLLDFLFKSKTN